MKGTSNSERGFTLPEMLITLAFFLVMSSVSLALVGSAVPAIRSDGQVTRLMGLLQNAREMAIARQRDIEMRFDLVDSTVSLFRWEEGVPVPVTQLVFEYRVAFRQFPGQGDTPEANGDDAPVFFDDAARLIFTSEGTLVDETGVPVSGTVFLGIEDDPNTARAVTVTGSTARARSYKYAPSGWFAK